MDRCQRCGAALELCSDDQCTGLCPDCREEVKRVEREQEDWPSEHGWSSGTAAAGGVGAQAGGQGSRFVREESVEETIRAKFQVIEVKPQTDTTTGEQYSEEVRMIPVYSPDPTTENYQFWQATPSGDLKMWINNPEAFGKFRVGQKFYLDFIPAEG